jgi:cyclopropane fatty-acyl-phospholipid synthase-like methyltransferase
MGNQVPPNTGTSFDRFADDYSAVRPGYPPAAIDTIIRETNMAAGSTVLEIGIGAGIATRTLLSSGASFIGLEPGQQLFNIAQSLMGDNSRIKLFNQTFEDFATDQLFDVVFSATAFHWLKDDKFERVAQLLKPNGHLVVMWNSFGSNNDPVDVEVAAAHQRYLPGIYPQMADINQAVLEKSVSKVRELVLSERFYLSCYGNLLLHIFLMPISLYPC